MRYENADRSDSIVRLSRHGVRCPAPVVGARQPAFSTSSGRVLLAHLPVEDAKRVVDASVNSPLSPMTLTDPDAIMERLVLARSHGYSIVEEEFVIGEISTAAPIFNFAGGAIGAISVPVPTTRWTVDAVRERLTPQVIQTARAISRAKGAAAAYD